MDFEPKFQGNCCELRTRLGSKASSSSSSSQPNLLPAAADFSVLPWARAGGKIHPRKAVSLSIPGPVSHARDRATATNEHRPPAATSANESASVCSKTSCPASATTTSASHPVSASQQTNSNCKATSCEGGRSHHQQPRKKGTKIFERSVPIFLLLAARKKKRPSATSILSASRTRREARQRKKQERQGSAQDLVHTTTRFDSTLVLCMPSVHLTKSVCGSCVAFLPLVL